MSEKIEPALTAEEWSDWEKGLLPLASRRIGIAGNVRIHMNSQPVDAPDEVHAMAALCLAGQPFGFAREDVDAIRSAADVTVLKHPEWPEEAHARLYTIADRIEALLPPEAVSDYEK